MRVSNLALPHHDDARSSTWQGDAFLVNSRDKTLRTFTTAESTQEHRFQNGVEKIQWKTCGFSSGTDYVIAGSSQEDIHKLYICTAIVFVELPSVVLSLNLWRHERFFISPV